MNKIYKVKYPMLLTAFVIFNLTRSVAQTIPVGTDILESYYRRKQLAGNLDSTISFALRPLSKEALGSDNVFDPLHQNGNSNYIRYFAKGSGVLQLLPISWQQQYNSHHPYGWNDEAMIPAKGYQTLISGGIFVSFGPLSIQLRPEYLYAQNSAFQSYGDDRSDTELRKYYLENYNYIDAPERFGNSSYKKFLLGQSSIRLTVGPASLGLSNESIWWGPGKRNALLLSNNARSFKHLTLNTVRAAKTFLGSFEGQIIAGRLEESGFSPLANHISTSGTDIWERPRPDWRYLSGLNISYNPKWVPGLFLGFIRTFMSYGPDLVTLNDYIPFFTPFQKSKFNDGLGDDLNPRDQRTSFYGRWVFPKTHAEVYLEYALNDNSYNFRDFIGTPQHSRAYIFGISKLVPLKGRLKEFLEVNAEVTQLSQSIDRIVRTASSFYYHSTVSQGYTNYGEVIGAGTGTGGNLQSLEINWVKDLKKIGLAVERYEHNSEFYDYADYSQFTAGSRRWIDFSVAAQGAWNYKNLLFNAKIQGVKSLNYQWRLNDYAPDKYYIPENDVFNFHGELGFTYRF